MNGWAGDINQAIYALDVAGADRDVDGRFRIYGEPPCMFMGIGPDCVISEKSEYSVGGRRFPWVGLLCATSYGHRCTVIGL